MKNTLVMIVLLTVSLSSSEATFRKLKRLHYDFEPFFDHFKKKLLQPLHNHFNKPTHQHLNKPDHLLYKSPHHNKCSHPHHHVEPIDHHSNFYDFGFSLEHGLGKEFDHGYGDVHNVGFDGYNGVHGHDLYGPELYSHGFGLDHDQIFR